MAGKALPLPWLPGQTGGTPPVTNEVETVDLTLSDRSPALTLTPRSPALTLEARE